MKKILFFLLFSVASFPVIGIEYRDLNCHLQVNPFDYDLAVSTIQGEREDSDVLLCCHGMGGDERIIARVYSTGVIRSHLVGFRFPDSGREIFKLSALDTHFGTIEELLPLLFLLKTLAVDASLSKIHLYGSSAGGGALINALAVLNEYRYRDRLEAIGIDEAHRKKIVAAIQNGWVVLECPLKSIDELIPFRKGDLQNLILLAERYSKNDLRPIDSLNHLSPLKLNILLYFQNPDEIIFNRDDSLYIHRLLLANPYGRREILIRNEGKHTSFHPTLWLYYDMLINR
jgi:hypothetical protein